MPALVAALQQREQRRQQARTELAALDRMSSRSTDFDAHRVLGDLREHLTDWQGMLHQEAPHARQALKALLTGRLAFTPKCQGGERWYEFSGPGTVSKLIEGLVFPKGVVAPTGFEPVFEPCRAFASIVADSGRVEYTEKGPSSKSAAAEACEFGNLPPRMK